MLWPVATLLTTCALIKKSKLQAWSVFKAADQGILDPLGALQRTSPLTQESLDVLCQFVSRIYGYNCPLQQARWMALQKKKVGAALASPTVAATTQQIMQAQLQTIIWEGAVYTSVNQGGGRLRGYSPSPLSFEKIRKNQWKRLKITIKILNKSKIPKFCWFFRL